MFIFYLCSCTYSAIFCAIQPINRSIASTDDHALWGEASRRYLSFILYRGDSRKGSDENTSNAAPRIVPLSNASANAASSTMPPLATFINIAEDFIFTTSSLLINPDVRSLSGQCIDTISDVVSRLSNSTLGYGSSRSAPDVE